MATGFREDEFCEKSVLLGSQDVSGSEPPPAIRHRTSRKQLLNTLTSSDKSSKTGLGATPREPAFGAVGLQENGSAAA